MTGYVENAWRDLDLAEEKQRDEQERKYKDILDILIQLAHALRGEAMEAARSKDPLAPFNWTRSDWNIFWFGRQRLVPETTAATWAKVSPDTVESDVAVLGVPKYNTLDVYQALQASRQVEDMQAKLEAAKTAHRNELARKNQYIKGLTRSLNAAEKLLKSAKSVQPQPAVTHIDVPAKHIQETNITNNISIVLAGEMFKKELALWAKLPVYDRLPDGWPKKFNATQNEARILADYQILFAMYSCGMSCKHKIDRLITALHSADSGGSKNKRGFHDLKQEKIITEYNFHLYENAELDTHVPFYALTIKGQQLCEDWGLPKADKPSVFEQALASGIDVKLPAVQAMLAFSLYSFMRKWESGYIQDDLSMEISNNGTSYRVIAAPKTISEKVVKGTVEKLLSNGDMAVGLVTLSSAWRKKYTEWTQKTGYSVVHVDIYHLITKEPGGEKIVPFTDEDYAGYLPLWVDN
ncbi:MAG: hypothetical protein K8R77_08485 [Anaerolineaceae bacterium]|nr:hypothetical protein [Anaerolineaceae bacterium]